MGKGSPKWEVVFEMRGGEGRGLNPSMNAKHFLVYRFCHSYRYLKNELDYSTLFTKIATYASTEG